MASLKERLDNDKVLLAEKLEEVEDIKKSILNLEELIEIGGRLCPSKGRVYWYINSMGRVNNTVWKGNQADMWRFDNSNCFFSEDDADFEVNKMIIIGKLNRLAREAGGIAWDTDCESPSQLLSIVKFRHGKNQVYAGQGSTAYETANAIHFPNFESVESAIEEIGAKDIALYLFGMDIEDKVEDEG